MVKVCGILRLGHFASRINTRRLQRMTLRGAFPESQETLRHPSGSNRWARLWRPSNDSSGRPPIKQAARKPLFQFSVLLWPSQLCGVQLSPLVIQGGWSVQTPHNQGLQVHRAFPRTGFSDFAGRHDLGLLPWIDSRLPVAQPERDRAD